MKHKGTIICIASAVLFMAAAFRPGCRIVLNGSPMPGVYDIAATARCAAAAERTAEEITRRSEAAPFTVVPVLCLQRDTVDETLLYHVLLEAYDGVEKLYEVTADGRVVGTLEDLRDIHRLQRSYPKLDIRFKECYTYPEAESDMAAVREALQVLDKGETALF